MISPHQSFHNPEFIRKKRKLIFRRILIIVGILIFIIGSFATLTRWDKVQIQTIRIRGAELLSVDDILHSAQEKLFGNYFYIFAKNNALLYPRSAIENYLVSQFPRIKDVSVGLSDYQTVDITVSERQPFAL